MWTLDTLLSRAHPGDRVFVRADLNVPLTPEGTSFTVSDDTRIRATIPTLTACATRTFGLSWLRTSGDRRARNRGQSRSGPPVRSSRDSARAFSSRKGCRSGPKPSR